ncbi:GH92 family glycosyl hydrolase [Phyllobacterium sp. UNC302MFCol5.2]|uniref:GH92 family glycosyl hydrolase n=1 Tax=Phyllobacterium sp. UNC302MFCol5.2 TaxID=1449065 RepID=UPI00068FBCC6|nr:GH92 family glycosyl hydrolase [Phyllobacterium sp. UNC302MFCol5.2]
MMIRRTLVASLLGCTILTGCDGKDEAPAPTSTFAADVETLKHDNAALKDDNASLKAAGEAASSQIALLQSQVAESKTTDSVATTAMSDAINRLQSQFDALQQSATDTKQSDDAFKASLQAGLDKLAELSKNPQLTPADRIALDGLTGTLKTMGDGIAAAANVKDLEAVKAKLAELQKSPQLTASDRTALDELGGKLKGLSDDIATAVKTAGDDRTKLTAASDSIKQLLEAMKSKADTTTVAALGEQLAKLQSAFDVSAKSSAETASKIAAQLAAIEGSMAKLVPDDLTAYVNQFVGTADAKMAEGAVAVAAGKGGSLSPGAGVPFGMVFWAPENHYNWESKTWPSGYYWSNNGTTKGIKGFSLTHMNGAGCAGNGGEFPMMPLTGASFDLSKGVTFSHANESAAAGYYQVKLDSNVNVELTATARTGFGRFVYPADGKAFLLIDPTRTNVRKGQSGEIKVAPDSPRALVGRAQTGAFCVPYNGDDKPDAFIYAEFNQDFVLTTIAGAPALEFTTVPGKPTDIMMKVGVSFVSQDNAKLNLQQESVKEWNFDAARAVNRKQWNDKLGTIKVDWDKAKNNDYFIHQKQKLYTFFFRSLLAPTIASDVDGSYMGFDRQIKKAEAGRVQYTNFSGWDIYRQLTPLHALFFPKEAADMAQSMVNMGKVCGALPRWVNYSNDKGVMSGDSGPIIVAQAHAFGATNFDTESARQLMVNAADDPVAHCQGKSIADVRLGYLSRGYIFSADWNGYISTSLELAASDYAVGKFASKVGDTANGNRLINQSASWKNSLNKTGAKPVMAQKGRDGKWGGSCAPNGCFMEGSDEQYLWMVLHDLGGLVDELGGAKATSDRLDVFFTELNAGEKSKHAYLGNEPSFGSAWVYNWTQNPAGTQRVVRRMVGTVEDFQNKKDAVFELNPAGLPGNDDLGSISAMYVWGALGFYPEIPGEGGVSLHSPLFPTTQLRLADGKADVAIRAANAPATYTQGLRLNGVLYDSTWLPVENLIANSLATLDFTLGDEPSQWATLATPAILPPSPAKGKVWEKASYKGLAAAFNNCGIGGLATSCITTSMMVPTPNDSVYSSGGVPGTSIDGTTLKLADVNSEGLKLIAGLFDALPTQTRLHPLGRDNVISYGQIVKFDKPLKGNTLFVLGAGSSGTGSGKAILTFGDGTTETVSISLPDWTDATAYSLPAIAATGSTDAQKLAAYSADSTKGNGYRIVYEADGRLKWAGGKTTTKARLYYQAIKLSGTKEIAQIELPDMASSSSTSPPSNLLHIFGINAADVSYP